MSLQTIQDKLTQAETETQQLKGSIQHYESMTSELQAQVNFVTSNDDCNPNLVDKTKKQVEPFPSGGGRHIYSCTFIGYAGVKQCLQAFARISYRFEYRLYDRKIHMYNHKKEQTINIH